MSSLKLEDTYGTYNLYNHEGVYYALDKSIGVTSVIDIIKEKKAISADTKNTLIGLLKDAEKWADSRGMYGLEDDLANKSLKVNSFTIYDNKVSKNYKKPLRVKTDEGIFVIDGSDVDWWNPKMGRNIRFSNISNYEIINAISTDAVPELIFAYNGYNIVEYDKIYYGIPANAGPVDLPTSNFAKIPNLIKGDLVKSVMLLIDEKNGSSNVFNYSEAKPDLNTNNSAQAKLIKTLNEINIVEYNGVFFGIPQKLGPIEISNPETQEMDGVLNSSSLELLISKIENPNGNIDKFKDEKPPQLIKTLNEINIVEYGGVFYGIPQQLGPVEISNLEIQAMDEILKSSNLETLIHKINNSNQTTSELSNYVNSEIKNVSSKKSEDSNVNEYLSKKIKNDDLKVEEVAEHNQNIIVNINNNFYYTDKKLWNSKEKNNELSEFIEKEQKYETLFYVVNDKEIFSNANFYEITYISEISTFSVYAFKDYFFAIETKLAEKSNLKDDNIFKNHSIHLDNYNKLTSLLIKFDGKILTDIDATIKSESYGNIVKTYKKYFIIRFEETFYGIPIESNLIDFKNDDPLLRNDVISDVSIYAVEELINDEINNKKV